MSKKMKRGQCHLFPPILLLSGQNSLTFFRLADEEREPERERRDLLDAFLLLCSSFFMTMSLDSGGLVAGGKGDRGGERAMASFFLRRLADEDRLCDDIFTPEMTLLAQVLAGLNFILGLFPLALAL